MFFAFTLTYSILFVALQFMGYAGAVRYPVDLGKFTFNKQRALCCVISILFTVGIVVAHLVAPSLGYVSFVLFAAQLIVAFVFQTVLGILCHKKYLQNIADEIVRLELDISEDAVVLRRKLMANSDISCSLAELSSAIDVIRKSKQ